MIIRSSAFEWTDYTFMLEKGHNITLVTYYDTEKDTFCGMMAEEASGECIKQGQTADYYTEKEAVNAADAWVLDNYYESMRSQGRFEIARD